MSTLILQGGYKVTYKDCKIVYVFNEEFLKYDFGPAHPLRPERQLLTYKLLEALKFFEIDRIRLEKPEMATMEDLRLFHTSEYIERVKRLSELGYGLLDLGDTPAFKGMFEASAIRVGATLTAIRLVMNGICDHAFNFSGGLHHARSNQGAGFCVFNDIAVGIKYLKRNYPSIERIAVVDVDAHHGDGTQYAFYDDPSVLTISLHEDGRFLYPGTGFVSEIGTGTAVGTSLNVPLPPGTFNDAYLLAFNEIVPTALKTFMPDIIIQQFGVDTHFSDPLTDFMLTNHVYAKIAGTMHKIVHEICDGRYVILGGGGYNPEATARSWAIVFSKIAGVDLPEKTPAEWRDFCLKKYGIRTSDTIFDTEYHGPSSDKRKFLIEAVKRVVEEVKERVIPLIPERK